MSSQTILLLSGDVKIQENFQVVGFSVNGRVVDLSGNGVSDAKVLLNGKYIVNTDSQGSFLLEKVSVGSYTIEAAKEHMTFTQLKDYKLTPSTVTLPSITVSGLVFFSPFILLFTLHATIYRVYRLGIRYNVQNLTSHLTLFNKVLGLWPSFC